MQRAVLMVGRAEIRCPQMWFAADPITQGSSQTRLADPCLAREQYDLTLADLGPLPATEHQIQLFLAANEWRKAAAQRLEAAFHRALTLHAPCLDWPRQTLQLDGTEVPAVE